MPHSMVLGANGQDGSYLVDCLLNRGHHVVGIGRNPSSLYQVDHARFQYISLDVGVPNALADLLSSFPLDYVFHAAAIHGPSGFQYEAVWQSVMAVNVGSVFTILEHARTKARDLRVVFAGSSKIFPSPLSGTVDEDTVARGSCLYSISKIASRDLLAYYRRCYGIPTTNLILFNHESPRRALDYLFPKLVDAVSSALGGSQQKSVVRTLDFKIDWSAADELMDIVVDIAQKSEAPELVLASGHTWDGQDAVSRLFAYYGMDWTRHIEVAVSGLDAGPQFCVDLGRLSKAVGRVPKKSIFDIANDIMSVRHNFRATPSVSRI
jgi:GDPmannose 4,6-dehydratase